MSKQTSKDQPAQPPQKPDAASAKPDELAAALARFSGILDKAAVPPAQDADSASEKPAR